jgi:ribosomal protein S18 acetylase RimI-like enzyme
MRRRLIMVKSLGEPREFPALPKGMLWHPWSDDLAKDLANLVVETYRGTPDADLHRETHDAARCEQWLRSHTERYLIGGTGVIRSGEGAVGGVVTFRFPALPGAAELAMLAVLPEARRHRLAATLMAISERACAEGGFPFTRLSVDAGSSSLVVWYRRQGYAIIDEQWVKARGVPLWRRVAHSVRQMLFR